MTTRLEIGGSNYPLAVSIPININFVLADIREPDKRNSSFSKTIHLYGTNEVNKLFENIFEVNSSLNTFNPNKKTEARYFANNSLVFKGSLQLLAITLKPDGLKVYDCSIIGYENGIFLELSDKMLGDLDFSAYDHVYSRANVVASWSNTGGTGYYYPHVDNGTSVNEADYKVENFMPCFFASEYIKKIISENGYSYVSAFLDSAFFESIIVYPNFNQIRINQTQIDNQEFYVGINSDINILSSLGYQFINYNNETGGFYDTGGQVSGTVVTINHIGSYNLGVFTRFKINFTHSDPTVTYAIFSGFTVANTIKVSTDGGFTYSNLSTNSFSNTFTLSVGVDYLFEVATGANDYFLNSGYKLKMELYSSFSTVDYYNASNVHITTGTGTPTFVALSGLGKTYFYSQLNSKTAIDGDTLDSSLCIPTNIKQKDFFKSILQLFNLYVDYDKRDSNKLIIEPYGDFFTGGIEDWNNKTDLSKDIKINPIGLLDAKRYVFKYKDDKDYYNTKYKDKWQETYGTEIINVDNDFLKVDKVNEVIFSPSPTISNPTMGANIVKIYKNQDTRAAEVPNIRLLIAGGIKQSTNAWTFRSTGLSPLVSTSYGSALMEDDDLNPTVSLQFGYPRSLFYDYLNSSFTSNTIYNIYHKPQIENITNKNSKVDVRYLYVTEREIEAFDFRKIHFIDNGYWIVNKIVNYNPEVGGSYQFELIKLLKLL